ncbi:MAG: ribonuclease 3 [Betaproteobacteria bacterium]
MPMTGVQMGAARLEHEIGYVFQQKDLLRHALTHRSHGLPHNERLEFLGDGVLNCIVAALLYERFPDLSEGQLSRLRASLVRQDTLVRVAERLRLGEHILLGVGELRSGGTRRPSILADALEAVFGAIFVDRGFDPAREVISRLFADAIAALDPTRSGKDAKSALQEWLQARGLPLPTYTLAATRGQAHAQEFDVVCEVPARSLRCLGSGPSRRAAEQSAASAAMDALRR